MFRRAKRKFLDLPLAQKFVSIFAVLTLLSGALMIGTLHLGLSVFEEKFYEKSLQELDFFVQRVDDNIEDIDTLTRSIAVDTKIQEKLNTLSDADPETASYYYQLTTVRQLLLEKIYQDRQISSLQYTDLYGHTLTIGQDMSDPGASRLTALETALDETPGGFVLVASDSADYPYILCGRHILRSQDMSLKKLGTIVAALNVGSLLDNEIHSLSSRPSELYLYNGSRLIYHSGGEMVALPAVTGTQGYRIATLNGKKSFVCWQTSSLTGLRLCSVFDYHEIYGQINTARNALIFGECAILALFAWGLLHMARLVTRPIHTLSEAVKAVDRQEGNFAAARAMLPADLSADEIGTLTREFDSMLDKIDTLIHENYEKQILLQETRYKMLQAQINPHFLYNTLGTLNWLVKAGNREDACRMIVSLGDILRAALSPRQNSTVAADVQLANSYIAIQQLRCKGRARFTLTSSGELEQWYLPHFTLQPLVENAVHYGVEESNEVCEIDVTAQADGDTLTLMVHNTGAPIAPERLAEIRTFTVKPQGHGIGLKNIHERLSMLYENFVFDFDSDETGTTVKIILRQEERKGKCQIMRPETEIHARCFVKSESRIKG